MVTLRDIYQQGRATESQVLRLTGRVDTLCKQVEHQRKERRSLYKRIREVELKLYAISGGITVMVFVMANWDSVGGMMAQ